MATFLGEDDAVQCIVVVNASKQYSIWPVGRSIPAGWQEEGFKGARADCLDHIAEVWVDPTAPI
ncbi:MULTISPECIES: MbtH family protein [unclassified Serratia (in: enterobacteria)]|uniref:MbtH family protein n=1 Tax=unclassified Serratia (in: enterobacteria) TaxID=2647522 RepID=UPI0030766D1C